MSQWTDLEFIQSMAKDFFYT